MTESMKEAAQQALQGLPDDELSQVLDFLSYLHWKREERTDWFQGEEWQVRYREAQADLAKGRYRDFDDVEDLIAELKSGSAE